MARVARAMARVARAMARVARKNAKRVADACGARFDNFCIIVRIDSLKLFSIVNTKVPPHYTLARVCVGWGPAFYKEGDVGREIFAVVLYLLIFVLALVLRYLLKFRLGINLLELN